MYEDPDDIMEIINSGLGVVGFDAGDQQRSAAVDGTNGFMLRNSNAFRLDGMVNEHRNAFCGRDIEMVIICRGALTLYRSTIFSCFTLFTLLVTLMIPF